MAVESTQKYYSIRDWVNKLYPFREIYIKSRLDALRGRIVDHTETGITYFATFDDNKFDLTLDYVLLSSTLFLAVLVFRSVHKIGPILCTLCLSDEFTELKKPRC